MVTLNASGVASKNKGQYLDDFKNVKENGWWKLSKFPALLCVIFLIQMYSLSDKSHLFTLAAFLFYAWIDIAVHMSLIEKKMNILYELESNRDVEK